MLVKIILRDVLVVVAAICSWASVRAESVAVKGEAGKGAGYYALYCAICHGETGAGDGLGEVNPQPLDFSDKKAMARLSNHQMFIAIKEGGPAVCRNPVMLRWHETLKEDQQIYDVIAYIRTLARD